MGRVIPLVGVFSLLVSLVPVRSLAVTTQEEIRAGQAEDEQITSSQVVESDPLLNAYARSIANKLWLQVARKDLPYNIKVIKASDINSFATEGGFVYIDEGLIDFVQSDDEFASVIGHETGHNERRHVITLNAKEEALQILAGLASIFSPFLMPASSMLGDMVAMKFSREDEIEADRTGLQLMSRAGYDPDAMLTMMRHMTVLEGDHSQLVDKYLEDHPDPDARVAHLLGYPELDPKKITEQQLLVQADSDAERARYSYAALKLTRIRRNDPDNVDALLSLAEVQTALGLTSKSQQTLAEANRFGTRQVRALVAMREAELRKIQEREVDLLKLDPDYHRLVDDVRASRAQLESQGQAMQSHLQSARDELKSIESQLNSLSQEMPQVNGQPPATSRIASVLTDLTLIARAVDSATDDVSQVVDNVGSLQHEDEGGLLVDSRELLDEMAAPLNMYPVPDESIPILASYPAMLRSISLSTDNVRQAVATATNAIGTMEQGIAQLDASMRMLGSTYEGYGDVGAQDFGSVASGMGRALASFNAAATTASQAAQLYNMARARKLSVRITLLGLGDSPKRYATLQYALQQRFGINGVDYRTMLRDGVTPGDVAAATIVAADTQSTPQTVIEASQRENTPVVDFANERGMHAWPLEIFMRLVYLDYTDDPVREMSTRAPVGAGSDD